MMDGRLHLVALSGPTPLLSLYIDQGTGRSVGPRPHVPAGTSFIRMRRCLILGLFFTSPTTLPFFLVLPN